MARKSFLMVRGCAREIQTAFFVSEVSSMDPIYGP